MPKITTKPIACINGSRSIKALNLNQYINPNDYAEIITGEASGVDTIAKNWAKSHHIEYAGFPANWKVHGKSAGMIRNHEMCDFADMLISFYDGKSSGTKEAIDYMHKMGKPVILHIIEELD